MASPAVRTLDWWFDFISPYAYIALEQFHRLPANVEVRLRPVLFAGLLGKWGQLGPAEIPSKRLFTYQYSQWLADRRGVTMQFPDAHPFNPLPFLRLSIACGNSVQTNRTIFRSIWADGREVGTTEHLTALQEALAIEDIGATIDRQDVKDELRTNTDRATELGVFGVPTFTVDGHIFWGVDGFDFLLDYLADDELFRRASMERAANTRNGIHRKEVTSR